MYESLHSNNDTNNNSNESSNRKEENVSCTDNANKNNVQLPSFNHVEDVQLDTKYLAHSLGQFDHQVINSQLTADKITNQSSMSLDTPPTPDLMMEGWPNIPIEDESTTAPNAVTEALQQYNLQ